MKKSVAMKWVKALRSGDYKQTKEALRKKDDSFCCLGVLCDISKKGTWEREECGIIEKYSRYVVDGESSSTAFPDEPVLRWAGLPAGLSKAGIGMYKMNDSYGLTFNEIADLIEVCWEDL